MKKIRIIQLVAVVFFTVSGGPYGLEPLLGYAGQHGALLLLLLTPMCWDIPAIFTVLELNSMMPITGGYYKWVKHALGTRWGFYEGWWTWLYTFVDLAIYPVLFITYLGYFIPDIGAWQRYFICLVFIWSSAGLNILGIVPVGKVSLILGAIVLTPFVILFGLAFYHHTGGLALPSPSLKGITLPSLGMALYTVMWNCLGWDNTTTYAEEVEKPIRSYLVSTLTAFGLVIVVYFLIVWVSQLSGIRPEKLEDGYPVLGELISGRWLGVLLAAGGMASALGIYASVLLSVSRVPMVMAEDKLLPAKLNERHKRFKTPYISIIICSAVVSGMVLWGFTDLLIIDVTIYGAGLALEYISLIRMRIKEPDTHRPFKIPLGIPGLCIGLILPVSVYFIALGGAFSSSKSAVSAAIFAMLTLCSAELLWQIIIFSRRKPKKTEEIR